MCKSLEENYSAQIKERSLFGQITCSGETQKKILESDMLGENCSVATPTPEDSGMSFTEQSGTPLPYQNPVQPDPSAENHLCGEFSQEHSALRRMRTGRLLFLRSLLTRIWTQSQVRSHALILTHRMSLDLSRCFLRGVPCFAFGEYFNCKSKGSGYSRGDFSAGARFQYTCKG